jgi:hypothetical protein
MNKRLNLFFSVLVISTICFARVSIDNKTSTSGAVTHVLQYTNSITRDSFFSMHDPFIIKVDNQYTCMDRAKFLIFSDNIIMKRYLLKKH